MIEITGTIKQILTELISNQESFSDKLYSCKLSALYGKRSLTANGYYWSLVQQFATWSGHSDTYIHNDIIEHYGQDLILDEESHERVTTLIRDDIDYHEIPYLHVRATSKTFKGDNGKLYRVCVVKRGSSTYNTAEFSRLVDGLIQTIQGTGAPIRTMTPSELARLKGYGYEV